MNMMSKIAIKFTQQEEEIRQRFIKRKEIVIFVANKEEFVELQERLIAAGLHKSGKDKNPIDYDKFVGKSKIPPTFLSIGSGCNGHGWGVNATAVRDKCAADGIGFEFVYYQDVKDTLDKLIDITRPRSIRIDIDGNGVKERVIFHDDHISIGKVKIELEDLQEIYLRAFGLKNVEEENVSKDESSSEEDVEEPSALLHMEV